MVELALNPLLVSDDVVGVFLVVGDLNKPWVSTLVLLMLFMVVPRHLGIVTLVILVEPAGVVTFWRKLGVMELFVIVASSGHVFRRISNLRIVRGGVIRRCISMELVLDLLTCQLLFILFVMMLFVDLDEGIGCWHIDLVQV